jgi:hypothetical protein
MADHLNAMETFTASSGLEPLLSIEQLAEYLGVPVTTIYDWRVDGLDESSEPPSRARRTSEHRDASSAWDTSATMVRR